MRSQLALLLLIGAVFSLQIDMYYGQGCPHCAATAQQLEALSSQYPLELSAHEVYYDADARNAMISEYDRFGYDVNSGGVPTSIVGGSAMVIGSLQESQWRELLDACAEGVCPSGVFTSSHFEIEDPQPPPPPDSSSDPIEEKNGAQELTLVVLIGAALVDSLNPCTIAVMVLLVGAVMASKGERSALVSGLIFTGVIFVMYILYGLGIMTAITAFKITSAFYFIVTAGALILALMELNAYFNYRPGFLAVEMPMWLRPYAKRATAEATSPLGIAAAAFLCSFFLLPCSSGPYLVVLGMLAKAATLQTLGYLVLYNLFFVLPLAAITLGIHFGKTSVEQVNEFKERNIRLIHLVSGLILLGLFIMMLGQATGWY